MSDFPDWLASTLASDATEGRGVLPTWIGALKPGTQVVGRAFVALMSQDDNLAVRDAGELRQMECFSVWCRGVTPIASQKKGPAIVGGSASIAGVIIQDGDLVIADDDGVVIWPKDQVDSLLIKAEAKLKQDNARLAQLQQKK